MLESPRATLNGVNKQSVRFNMNEEGIRFFRYVLPGLVFFIETLLFAYIILPEQTVCFLNDHFKDLGTAAAVFLASGGLGFIFASIHHFVHWQPCFSCFENTFDHRIVINKLHASQLIDPTIWEEINKNYSNQTKAKMEALKHSQSLWYKLLKPRRAGKVAIDNLGHRAQGLGAARIASVFALFRCYLLVRAVWDPKMRVAVGGHAFYRLIRDIYFPYRI